MRISSQVSRGAMVARLTPDKKNKINKKKSEDCVFESRRGQWSENCWNEMLKTKMLKRTYQTKLLLISLIYSWSLISFPLRKSNALFPTNANENRIPLIFLSARVGTISCRLRADEWNRMATSSATSSFYLIKYVIDANCDQWTLHQ